MSFTGYFDLDSIILNKLNDKDLAAVCQTNKAASYICSSDRYWLNRTLFYFGKYLGGGENIKNNYLKGRTWQEYYKYLIQNKDKIFENGSLENIIENYEDLVLLRLANIWTPEEARIVKDRHYYINFNINKRFWTILPKLFEPSSDNNTVFIPALRVAGNRDLIRLYFTKVIGFSEDEINRYLKDSYTRENALTTMKNKYDEELLSRIDFIKNKIKNRRGR